jgi:hypothetical protein
MIAALALAAVSAMSPQEISATIFQHGDKTVAIIPWNFRGGTPGAVETARRTIDGFFDRAGYDRISTSKVDNAWPHRHRLVGSESETMPEMPTDDALRHIGHDLGANMVCVGDVSWHTRSIWVALGPKTKSTCTLSMKLMNLDNNATVLSDKDLVVDDTAEESGFQTAAGILTGGLVTIVSGGPETPHQQRAVQVALSQAFEPWLEGVIGH